MQIEAKKNTAYYLCWPMVNSTTPANFSSGLTVTVAAYYKDGIGAWTAFTPVDTPAEIGTTGIYEMDLSAAEMNHDKVLIKFTASGAAATAFMFDTRTKLTDDLNDLAQSDILSDATPFAGANVDAKISDIPTAAEIDAQLTASHGSGAWTSGGAGSGARTVTTTVNDGTNPIEGAKVRYTLGAENYVQTTDVNGQCTHNLDDGTWTVAITKAGYSFSGSTLAVSADATPTYSMTQVTITTSDPGFTTLFADVYDEDGTKTGAGTKVYLAIVSVPSGDTGHVFDSQPRVETTDSNGLVQFTNCVQGAVYELWRGRRGTPTRVTIGTDPTQAAPSIIGSD